jgi:hypothetical protein
MTRRRWAAGNGTRGRTPAARRGGTHRRNGCIYQRDRQTVRWPGRFSDEDRYAGRGSGDGAWARSQVVSTWS